MYLFNPTVPYKGGSGAGWVVPVSFEVIRKQSFGGFGSKVVGYGIAWERTALAVARFILLESLKLVPIDTGLLASTGMAYVEGRGLSAEGIVSFSTSYGKYVYYDPNAAHGTAFNLKYAAEIQAGQTHARRPKEQYDWIREARRRNELEIKAIVDLEMYHKGASNFMIRTAGYDLHKDRHKERFPVSRNPFRL